MIFSMITFSFLAVSVQRALAAKNQILNIHKGSRHNLTTKTGMTSFDHFKDEIRYKFENDDDDSNRIIHNKINGKHDHFLPNET